MNLERRQFLKGLGAAAAAAVATGFESTKAIAEEIKNTYAFEERDESLEVGKQLYAQLLERNPDLAQLLRDHMLSSAMVTGGPRNNPSSYEAFAIHQKHVEIGSFMAIGPRGFVSSSTLDKFYPGVLAVIPAEKNMSYERFRDLYNRFVVTKRAKN